MSAATWQQLKDAAICANVYALAHAQRAGDMRRPESTRRLDRLGCEYAYEVSGWLHAAAADVYRGASC